MPFWKKSKPDVSPPSLMFRQPKSGLQGVEAVTPLLFIDDAVLGGQSEDEVISKMLNAGSMDPEMLSAYLASLVDSERRAIRDSMRASRQSLETAQGTVREALGSDATRIRDILSQATPTDFRGVKQSAYAALVTEFNDLLVLPERNEAQTNRLRALQEGLAELLNHFGRGNAVLTALSRKFAGGFIEAPLDAREQTLLSHLNVGNNPVALGINPGGSEVWQQAVYLAQCRMMARQLLQQDSAHFEAAMTAQLVDPALEELEHFEHAFAGDAAQNIFSPNDTVEALMQVMEARVIRGRTRHDVEKAIAKAEQSEPELTSKLAIARADTDAARAVYDAATTGPQTGRAAATQAAVEALDGECEPHRLAVQAQNDELARIGGELGDLNTRLGEAKEAEKNARQQYHDLLSLKRSKKPLEQIRDEVLAMTDAERQAVIDNHNLLPVDDMVGKEQWKAMLKRRLAITYRDAVGDVETKKQALNVDYDEFVRDEIDNVDSEESQREWRAAQEALGTRKATDKTERARLKREEKRVQALLAEAFSLYSITDERVKVGEEIQRLVFRENKKNEALKIVNKKVQAQQKAQEKLNACQLALRNERERLVYLDEVAARPHHAHEATILARFGISDPSKLTRKGLINRMRRAMVQMEQDFNDELALVDTAKYGAIYDAEIQEAKARFAGLKKAFLESLDDMQAAHDASRSDYLDKLKAAFEKFERLDRARMQWPMNDVAGHSLEDRAREKAQRVASSSADALSRHATNDSAVNGLARTLEGMNLNQAGFNWDPAANPEVQRRLNAVNGGVHIALGDAVDSQYQENLRAYENREAMLETIRHNALNHTGMRNIAARIEALNLHHFERAGYDHARLYDVFNNDPQIQQVLDAVEHALSPTLRAVKVLMQQPAATPAQKTAIGQQLAEALQEPSPKQKLAQQVFDRRRSSASKAVAHVGLGPTKVPPARARQSFGEGGAITIHVPSFKGKTQAQRAEMTAQGRVPVMVEISTAFMPKLKKITPKNASDYTAAFGKVAGDLMDAIDQLQLSFPKRFDGTVEVPIRGITDTGHKDYAASRTLQVIIAAYLTAKGMRPKFSFKTRHEKDLFDNLVKARRLQLASEAQLNLQAAWKEAGGDPEQLPESIRLMQPKSPEDRSFRLDGPSGPVRCA